MYIVRKTSYIIYKLDMKTMCVNAQGIWKRLKNVQTEKEISCALTHMVYDIDLERLEVPKKNLVRQRIGYITTT
jgi:hypothetical protein